MMYRLLVQSTIFELLLNLNTNTGIKFNFALQVVKYSKHQTEVIETSSSELREMGNFLTT